MKPPPSAAAPSGVAPPAAARESPVPGDGEQCPNCGATLWGEFCFACGQPRKGLIRRFGSILGDVADTVFSLDNRLWRTLVPLYVMPGQLSLDYFAGRRVRYVPPFRLFFFLCVLAFLALQWLAETNPGGIRLDDADGERAIATAATPAEVDAALAEALAELERGRAAARAGLAAAGDGAAPEATGAASAIEASLAAARRQLEADAERRKAELARDGAVGGDEPPRRGREARDEPSIRFGSEPWDPVSNPLELTWLPAAVNDELNRRIGRAREALRHARQDPRPLIEAFFGAIPPVLFVLMPLFALVLKAVYLFRHRLYMEHLLVALHSHAFLFLSLLLIALLQLARDALAPDGAARAALGGLATLIAWWIPLYLLVAQKRIYRQGWLMTLLKYGVVGLTYIALLAAGLVLTVLMGLLTL